MLCDAHCHPTDTPGTLDAIAGLPARLICMTTRFDDVDLVDRIANFPNVIPAYGLHPWFSHLVSFENDITKEEHYSKVFSEPPSPQDLDQLPSPIYFPKHVQRLEQSLERHPRAIVGEIGLDKAFRVKLNGILTHYRVLMSHQRRVLAAQLKLASDYNRSVSMHGVHCHQALYDECSNYKLRSLCLHSYSGSADFYANQWLKIRYPVYVSVAVLINGKSPQKLHSMLAGVPADRILTESDYHDASGILSLLEQSYDVLANFYGWSNPRQVVENFENFLR